MVSINSATLESHTCYARALRGCFLSFASSHPHQAGSFLCFDLREIIEAAPFEFDQFAQLRSGSLRCHFWRCIAVGG